MDFPRCVCDTGAGISTISLPTSQRLGFHDLEPCPYTVRLADYSVTETHGILKDVPIEVGPKTILTDLVVMDVKEGSAESILLGRPFLMSAKAVIDMVNQTIELDFEENHKLVFNAQGKMLYSQKIKVDPESNSNLSFWLDPMDTEKGVKEYAVLGGRKLPMPHERFPHPKPRCIGPFGIGRRTPNGKIAITAPTGTMLPLTGKKVQLYLMETEKTTDPDENNLTPDISTNDTFSIEPSAAEEFTENGVEKKKTKRYIPPHLRARNPETNKKEEGTVWDTLGEPKGHHDFYVKYTPPPSSKVDIKDIIPSGWDEPERTLKPLIEPLD